ncbi:TrkH family potassium uptake protein [Xanthobacter tagetidis]|uniref:Trk system potassium uptake protein n=1 Tax=Xanthobacter tagetidis TaxID=60216 RepID=A0A3L7ANH9_9HYPH|nr:TrkH family potassium uptake protein [Xanthobacter tagetidis]MBB6308038.1 trk system potassium uptake protein TrkH [Xanthobacter tagetidis]RLP81674.1 TrkH family potassium uptake protein [Xanthobacter tagetidis]
MNTARLPAVEAQALSTLNLRPVAATLGILLAILGVSMLLPAFVDFAARSGGHQSFIGAAAVTIFVGVLLWMSGREHKVQKLDLRQAFLLTSSVWIVLALFAALPLMWGSSQLSFTKAVFEAMSGLTTTGASTMSGLDAQAPGILLWRALLHWFGGVGIIAIAIAVLPVLSIGGMQLFRMESSDKSDKFLPRAGAVAKGLLTAYLLLTLLCAVAYAMAGLGTFDAVTLAMSTLSTGGFANSDYSLSVFKNPAVDYVAIVFMIVGALPFPLYVRALSGDTRRFITHSEVRVFLGLILFFTALSFVQQVFQGIASGETALRGALFTVVSLMTTTGLMAVDYTNWGPLSDAIFFVVMFLGGCTGSTSGGLKAMRIAITGKAIRQHLKRVSFRSGVFPVRYGGAPVADDVVASVLGFVFLFIFTFLVAAIGLNLMGLDIVTAFSAAIACLANVGPGLGPVVGPASNFGSLPDAAIWLLTLTMMLGRLEILTVLVLVLPRFWNR